MRHRTPGIDSTPVNRAGRTLTASQLVSTGQAGFSLTVRAGECVGLTGPSGSGKTRLLRAIADLDPISGELRLDDVPSQRFSGPQWRSLVMLVPSESYWWSDRIVDHFPHPPGAQALADLALAPDLLERAPGDVSSGERQRLALLRAVVRDPALLLLDEPTANLDGANAAAVETWLAAMRQRGAGLLWVSHDLAQVARLADRALHLAEGVLSEYLPWT